MDKEPQPQSCTPSCIYNMITMTVQCHDTCKAAHMITYFQHLIFFYFWYGASARRPWHKIHCSANPSSVALQRKMVRSVRKFTRITNVEIGVIILQKMPLSLRLKFIGNLSNTPAFPLTSQKSCDFVMFKTNSYYVQIPPLEYDARWVS
jgi:hypothetical protein